MCDLETSRMGAPYIYDISHLRVNSISTGGGTVVIFPAVPWYCELPTGKKINIKCLTKTFIKKLGTMSIVTCTRISTQHRILCALYPAILRWFSLGNYTHLANVPLLRFLGRTNSRKLLAKFVAEFRSFFSPFLIRIVSLLLLYWSTS